MGNVILRLHTVAIFLCCHEYAIPQGIVAVKGDLLQCGMFRK